MKKLKPKARLQTRFRATNDTVRCEWAWISSTRYQSKAQIQALDGWKRAFPL